MGGRRAFLWGIDVCGTVFAIERVVDITDDGESSVFHLLAHAAGVDRCDALEVTSTRKYVALVAVEKLEAERCEYARCSIIGGATAYAQHDVPATLLNGMKNHIACTQS